MPVISVIVCPVDAPQPTFYLFLTTLTDNLMRISVQSTVPNRSFLRPSYFNPGPANPTAIRPEYNHESLQDISNVLVQVLVSLAKNFRMAKNEVAYLDTLRFRYSPSSWIFYTVFLTSTPSHIPCEV